MTIEKVFSVLMMVVYSISILFPVLAKLVDVSFVTLQSQLKSFLFLGMMVFLCLNLIHQYASSLEIPKAIARFLGVLLATIFLFFVRVKLDGTDFNTWNKHFQLLGLPYVFFAVFAFQFITNIDKIYLFLRLLVYSSFGLSLIAIFQWVVGPSFLMALGLDLSVGGLEFTLGSAKDKEGDYIFRAFATLNNHYELAAILIVGVLALFILFKLKQIAWSSFLAFFCTIVFGLLTTYNITGWLLLLITSFVFIKLSNKFSINQIRYYHSLKGKLTLLFILCFVSVILVATNVVDRLVINTNLVDSSFAWRLFFMQNQISSLFASPFGLGWSYGYETGKALPFMATADNYFLWVSMLGGFPFYLLFLYLFFAPLWFGYKNMKKVYCHYPQYYYLYIGIWCFVFSGVVCCFSNAFITYTGVSNYFFWIAVGLIYKIGGFSETCHHESLITGKNSASVVAV